MESTGHWVVVPPSRILGVSAENFRLRFNRLNSAGGPVAEGEEVYRCVSRDTGEIFQLSRFIPLSSLYQGAMVYLEPIPPRMEPHPDVVDPISSIDPKLFLETFIKQGMEQGNEDPFEGKDQRECQRLYELLNRRYGCRMP